MVRTFSNIAAAVATAVAAAVVLLAAAPAAACEAHKPKTEQAAKPAAAAGETATTTTTASVLAPVDEVLSATCNCAGPGDCTCKKGECKCKKCSKQHQVKPGAGSTRLMAPLKNQQRSPELPQNARYDATGGVLL